LQQSTRVRDRYPPPQEQNKDTVSAPPNEDIPLTIIAFDVEGGTVQLLCQVDDNINTYEATTETINTMLASLGDEYFDATRSMEDKLMKVIPATINMKDFIKFYIPFLHPALNGGLFKVAGTMVAVSLIHGGPAPHFFSRSLYNIVSYGFEAAAPLVEEVSDPETKLLIEAIVNATSTEELHDAVESASFLMGLAGIIRVTPSLPDKESIAKEHIQFLVIDRARSAYESFLEGLSTMGLLDLIRSHPLVMEECFMRSEDILTASRMERLVYSHAPSRGQQQKNGQKPER
ncbi:putative G2/M phase-specific E3 ubiquitin-protein ligase, partial [Apostichopus japonicus]